MSSEEIAASGTCGDNLTWTVSEDGILTISGTGEMYDYVKSGYSSERAPWSSESFFRIVIEEGVTSIGEYAFFYCSDILYSVEIASSVISIGRYAFFTTTIEEITGGEGVTTIV